MPTGSQFHTGWVETKAARIEVPTERNAAVVSVATSVAFIYPVLPTMTGVDICAETGRGDRSPSVPTANSNVEHKETSLTLLTRKSVSVGSRRIDIYGNNP
jgi:hypothetical protein